YVRSYRVEDKLYPVTPKHNENAADMRSILNFIDWCVNKVEVGNNGQVTKGRRADKYALIFSGHSLGFQDIGLFKDESSGKALNMKDFYALLLSVVQTQESLDEIAAQDEFDDEVERIVTTKLLGQKLDLLGFD